MSKAMHNGMRMLVDPEKGLVYGRKGGVVGDITNFGYVRIGAWINGKVVRRQAHQMIWEAVNGPIPDGMVINHINGKKTDNRIENLEAVTPSENAKHAFAMGLNTPRSGDLHGMSKLTWDDVAVIRRKFSSGVKKSELSREFGVALKHINRIVNNKAWRLPHKEACSD